MMCEEKCCHGVPTNKSPWRFTSIDVKDCPYCEIDRLSAQLAEWYKVFGHLSKDADTAGNIINEGIAERDKLIEDQQAEIAHLTFRGSDDARGRLDAEHAMRHQRFELERLKEESSHLWVRIESGEAAAYEQGKAEARKQAAQEIIEEVIGDWNCDCGYGGLVIADAIKAKFKLEE